MNISENDKKARIERLEAYFTTVYPTLQTWPTESTEELTTDSHHVMHTLLQHTMAFISRVGAHTGLLTMFNKPADMVKFLHECYEILNSPEHKP